MTDKSIDKRLIMGWKWLEFFSFQHKAIGMIANSINHLKITQFNDTFIVIIWEQLTLLLGVLSDYQIFKNLCKTSETKQRMRFTDKTFWIFNERVFKYSLSIRVKCKSFALKENIPWKSWFRGKYFKINRVIHYLMDIDFQVYQKKLKWKFI